MTESQTSSTITAASPASGVSDRIVAACLGAAVLGSSAWAVMSPSGRTATLALGLVVIAAAWAAQLGQHWVVTLAGSPAAAITHRRWIRTTSLRADEIRSATTRRDDLHIGDLVLLGPGWRAITVPVEVLDAAPDFALAVRALVADPTTRVAQPDARTGAVGDRQGARVPTGTFAAR